MFAAFESATPRQDRKRPRVGDLVSGTIISIGKDAVFVDIGGKAEGTLDRAQVEDRDGKMIVAIGETVEARVAQDAGGVLSLRIKVMRGPEAKAELVSAQEMGLPVEGLVTEVVKGGLSVDVAGVRGFCPASQIDNRFVEDLAGFVGQRLTFRISRYEPGGRGNLVLSRRVLLEEEREKIAAKTREHLKVGATMRGKVVGFKPFGAFVDLGGIEGMLHVSELGFSRVERPEDVLALGQEVDVAVLKIEPGDKGQRIALSLKALAADPWHDASRTLVDGARIKGKIVRMQPFGVFVEVAPGIEGLVHISELGAGRRINHPREVVSEGQEVEVQVMGVDPERRRVSLSMAAAAAGGGASAEDVAAATQRSSPSAQLGTLADLLKLKR
ncbi:MAG TPA: S1 RNA-binding domain-containing protein [Kofleriaceae bacterium]|nr:S1 RNA-binding domain-containing protein [Kofleriaceae bacterium]